MGFEQNRRFRKSRFFKQEKLRRLNRQLNIFIQRSCQARLRVAIRSCLAPKLRAVTIDLISVIDAVVVTDPDHVCDLPQPIELRF